MRFSAALLLASLLGSATASPAVVEREPQLSILPADGYESILDGAFGNLWGAVENGLEKLEHAIIGEDAVIEGEGMESTVGWPKKKSVYEILSEDEKFSKLFFLINQDPDSVDFLSSTHSSKFTLLAPTNEAFPAPHHHQLPLEFGNPLSLETLHRYFSHHPKSDDRWHKLAVRILHGLLQYHLLPSGAYALTALAKNSTAASALTIPGALLGAPQRIKLDPALRPLPTLQLNFAGHVVAPDLWASNGVVHGVNRALQPGLSAMEEIYAVPWLFPAAHFGAPWALEVTAAALARAGLDHVVDYRPVFHHHSFNPSSDAEATEEVWLQLAASALTAAPEMEWKGSPAVTIFAPSNKAWKRLPPRLSKWLFSPWGEWALGKLLRYHIINGTVVHSDWIHPSLSSSSPGAAGAEGEEAGEELWPKYDVDQRFPTLLGKNWTLPIHIAKRPVFRLPKDREVAAYSMRAAGVEVKILDIPVRNGAVQVVERVLNPLKHHKREERKRCAGAREEEPLEVDEEEWEGWEDWFVQWAMNA